MMRARWRACGNERLIPYHIHVLQINMVEGVGGSVMLDVYIIHAGDDSGGRNGVMQEITEVRQSIWKAHWKNAREVGFKDILKKLLDNHISLYSDANYYPEERVERRKIIQYLQDKIETLYGQA